MLPYFCQNKNQYRVSREEKTIEKSIKNAESLFKLKSYKDLF